MRHIYLDHNASTPLLPAVVRAMQPYIKAHYGNPSSLHWAGTQAKLGLAQARAQVATLLGCTPLEVVFTSGGTESSNMAIKGVAFARPHGPMHIVISGVEHPATVNPCRFLERFGVSTTVVPVDKYGLVDPKAVKAALRPETVLVSIMHANNEVGTIQPIADIALITRKRGVLLHCDAAQSVGKIPVLVDDLKVDLLTIAGHKLHAPKGIGALYIRAGTHLEPFMHGAGHEAGRRAGTENVLLAVALGAACEAVSDLQPMHAVEKLRDRLWEGIQSILGDQVIRHGHPSLGLPNTLNVGFADRVGGDVLALLTGVAGSTGSACHAGHTSMSPVLKAMGADPRFGLGAVRFSLGRTTTEAEIEHVLRIMPRVLRKVDGPANGKGHKVPLQINRSHG